MDELSEQALAVGRQTQGIVRVGQTVRRALHERSDYGHALLRHLEAVGFHGDLGPHNIVFDGDMAVGIIDWDASVGPGSRLVDLGHAVWCCADVAERAVPVAEQARKLRRMCDAYGWAEVDLVVQEIGDRFRRARDQHARAGRTKGAAISTGRSVGWTRRRRRWSGRLRLGAPDWLDRRGGRPPEAWP